MSKILYYLILLPLSKLPLPVLYLLADLLYIVFLTFWPYRKKVVTENLRKSFPEKSDGDIRQIRNLFYRHFADLIAEGIKNLSISKKELIRRMHVDNPEVLLELANKNRNLLLVGAHYGNWEWVITAQALLFKQHAIGLGKPLSNDFLDLKINALRGRYGMDIVHAKNYKSFIEKEYNHGFAMLTLSDQSPGDSLKSYWTYLLHQPSAMLFGAEQMAHQFDLAVVFFKLSKTKRGHYTMSLSLICESPLPLPYGEITERYTRLLEKQIQEKPELWLWSHKRWKREIPENLHELMQQQKIKFEQKFKS
jgi:KDO2-lipid IV(A) lauroyltransferase